MIHADDSHLPGWCQTATVTSFGIGNSYSLTKTLTYVSGPSKESPGSFWIQTDPSTRLLIPNVAQYTVRTWFNQRTSKMLLQLHANEQTV